MRTSLWLCIYLPFLPLEVALAQFSRSRHSSSGAGASDSAQVVVVEEKQKVVQANSKARQLGISTGCSLATAQTLSPGLLILPRAPQAEALSLQQLVLQCQRFTPAVSIQQQQHISLDLSACLRVNRGLAVLQEQLQQLLANRHRYRLGLAHSASAALLLSHAADAPEGCQSITGFNYEQQQLDRAALEAQIRVQPLTSMNIDRRIISALQAMGCHSLGDVLRLPGAELGQRFGEDFIHHLQALTGTRQDRLPPCPQLQYFREQRHFDQPVQEHAHLLPVMEELLGELGNYLRERQLWLNTFVWRLQGRHRCRSLQVKLSQASARMDDMLALSQLQLEQLDPDEGLESLTLEARYFSHSEHVTQALFGVAVSTESGLDSEARQRLLDRLTARLKPGAIVQGIEMDSHLPEARSLYITPGSGKSSRHKALQSVIQAERLPLWLLSEPAAICQHSQGLYYRQTALQLIQGPQRIDTHWWRCRQQRDYYLARDSKGRRLWIYRDLQTQRWFVHGLFA